MAVPVPKTDPRTGAPLNVNMPGTPLTPTQAGYSTPPATPAPPVIQGKVTGGTYGNNSATPGAAYGGTAAPWSIQVANNTVPVPPQNTPTGVTPPGVGTPTPMGQGAPGNSGFSIDKNALQAEAAARIAKQREAIEGAVNSGKTSRTNLFNFNKQNTQDQRVLDAGLFNENNSPFTGQTGYLASNINRNNGINDAFAQNNYTNDINTLDNQLTSFDSLAPEQQQTLYNDLLRQEREYGLQEGALTGNFNGGQTLAAKTADQNYQLGLGGLTGSINGQDTLAKTNADRGYGLDLAGLSGQLPNGGGQTLQAKQLDRNNFESDRSYELAKSSQDWNQTFQKEQFTEQKAETLWNQAFKTKDFNQSVKDAAASRGLQWANLTQQDKHFVADMAFKEKSFTADQTQRGIDNTYKQLQSDSSPEIKKEIDGLYTGLTTGQINPAAALDEINGKEKVGILTKADADKMRKLVTTVGGNQSTSPVGALTPQQIEANGGVDYQSMNADQMGKLWETDPTGKKAGTAKYDWAQWSRDPRGRLAGTSYDAWHQIYGPTLKAQ